MEGNYLVHYGAEDHPAARVRVGEKIAVDGSGDELVKLRSSSADKVGDAVGVDERRETASAPAS